MNGVGRHNFSIEAEIKGSSPSWYLLRRFMVLSNVCFWRLKIVHRPEWILEPSI